MNADVRYVLHEGDLPAEVTFTGSVAVDTETQGLNPLRDRLCLVQLCGTDGLCHLVRFAPGVYEAPNLKAVLGDSSVTKIFHFGRFDIAVLRHAFGVVCDPVFCTKIASRLVRTYTDGHGLKDLVHEVLGITMDKGSQSSDWANPNLSDEQLHYAACDVVYLHRVMASLHQRLERENRLHLAQACFDFLPTRAELDLAGWPQESFFDY